MQTHILQSCPPAVLMTFRANDFCALSSGYYSRESRSGLRGEIALGLWRSQSRKVPLRGRDGGSGKWAFRVKGGAD